MSDHNEHACTHCGSLLHHIDQCRYLLDNVEPTKARQMYAETFGVPQRCTECNEFHAPDTENTTHCRVKQSLEVKPNVKYCEQCARTSLMSPLVDYCGKLLCVECVPQNKNDRIEIVLPGEVQCLNCGKSKPRSEIAPSTNGTCYACIATKKADAPQSLDYCPGKADELERLRERVTELQLEVVNHATSNLASCEALETARIQFQEQEAALYVPGLWACNKCKFTQINKVLYTRTGNVGANLAQETRCCPNCGDEWPLSRVTWEENTHHMAKAMESQVARAVAAEDLLKAERERGDILVARLEAAEASGRKAEQELRHISENLCGVKVEGDVSLDMVYAFVEGQIDKYDDLRNTAERKLFQTQQTLDIKDETIRLLREKQETLFTVLDEAMKIINRNCHTLDSNEVRAVQQADALLLSR
jgi:hypothetical protein